MVIIGNDTGNDYGTTDSGPHAVLTADDIDYTYDDVGNMVTATDAFSNTTTYSYDDLSHLTGVDFPTGDDLSMVYDADGMRVSRVEGDTTVTYVGGLFEVEDDGATTTVRTHYTFGGDHVAVRVDDGSTDTLTYLFTDHLGSVAATYDAGTAGTANRYLHYYYPYGEPRGTQTDFPSDHTYTGQIDDPGALMYYRARYYQPSLGRFTQADTIIPNPADSQDWNRYMYVRGNPISGSDPSGRCTIYTESGAAIQAYAGPCDGYGEPTDTTALPTESDGSSGPDEALVAAPPKTGSGTLIGVVAGLVLEELIAGVNQSENEMLRHAAEESQSNGRRVNWDSGETIGLWRLTDPGGEFGPYWSFENPIAMELFNEGNYYDRAGIPFRNKGTLLVYAEFPVSAVTEFGTAGPANDRPAGRGNRGGMAEFVIPGGVKRAIGGYYDSYPLAGEFEFHMCSSYGCWPSTEVTQKQLYGWAE